MVKKQWLLVSLLLLGMLFTAGGVVSALQVVDPPLADPPKERFEEGEILSWLTGDSPDWSKGGIFAGLGLVGALVTLFGLVGGVIPGTAGQARMEADSTRLEVMSTRLDELIGNPASTPAGIEAVQKAVNELRDDLRAEKRNQFATASLIYAFLGAAFATILASTLLQAIVIGAGWTGLIGSLGLKKDNAERGAIKNDALQKAEQAMDTLQQRGAANVNLKQVYEALRVARSV